MERPIDFPPEIAENYGGICTVARDECQECAGPSFVARAEMHITDAADCCTRKARDALLRSPAIVTRVTESKVEYAGCARAGPLPAFLFPIRPNEYYCSTCFLRNAAAATCARCSFPLHFARLVPVSIAKAYVYALSLLLSDRRDPRGNKLTKVVVPKQQRIEDPMMKRGKN